MTSLLAVLTVKVSAILLLTLVGALCLRTRSAAARRWVLAVGVVAACLAPALHAVPVPSVVRVAPFGALDWSAGHMFAMLGLRPYALFTADADALGRTVASESAAFQPGRSGHAVTAVAHDHVVGRLAVTIWLVGAVARAGVLLVGMARLRWLRASSRRATDGRWHRLCADLARSCGLRHGVDLLFGPRPGLVATWGWRRPAVMLPASASGWSEERMRVSRSRSSGAHLLGRDDGSFEIFDLEPGEYGVDVRMPGYEPLYRRFSLEAGQQREEKLVLTRTPASRLLRTGAESATAGTVPTATGRLAETTGSAVGQEPPTASSSARIAELVERAAALQEQLRSVLDELQTVLDEPDRAAGRPDEPIRIGNGVPPPTKIHDVPPVYPPAAREAGVQGLVILEATIDPTGEVGSLEVLRSVPELEEAAVAAVEQWRYEPTLVDGAPVSVLMTVTINFLLP